MSIVIGGKSVQLAILAENYLNLRRYKRRTVVSPRVVARRHSGVPPRARFLGGNRMLEMTNENFARLLRGLTIAVGNRRNRILLYTWKRAHSADPRLALQKAQRHVLINRRFVRQSLAARGRRDCSRLDGNSDR
jgi:hypothetical protein